ncbi:MAG: hypothetical protein HEQ25_09525 [Dolichospermum sp. DET73]|jgi:hypothetical protein|nr:hypothetical protein [Dolichospermum sp. DET73]MBO1052216.1 hypothetical protein [Dolichospermum sp. DET73]
MKLSQILPLVLGSAVAGVVVSMSPAQAIIFNVNGTDYDVTTVTTSYNADSTLLQSQPWWGNATLASQFASTVQQGLPGSFSSSGPFFAYSATLASGPGFTFTQVGSYEYISIANPQVVTRGVNSSFSGVYATATVATPVPWDTTPGAMLPTIPILALMYRWKQSRKRIALKSNDNAASTVVA